MANVVALNAYQLNQHPIQLGDATAVGLPTQGCVLGSCANSQTRSLSTGVNVYSFAVTPSGDKYYFQQTYANLVVAFNA